MRPHTLLLCLLLAAACAPAPTTVPPLPTLSLTAVVPTVAPISTSAPIDSQSPITPIPTKTQTPEPLPETDENALATFQGTWLTGQPFPPDPDRIPHAQVTLRLVQSTLVGTFEIPLLDTSLTFDSVADGSTLQFNVEHPDGTLHYDLAAANEDELAGIVSRDNQSTPVQFLRLAPLAAGNLAAFEGWYEAPPDRLLRVYMEGPAFMYRDYTTGRVGQLLPTSANTFVTGPGRFVPYPVEAELTFAADGSLTFAPIGAPLITAQRLPDFYRTEEVTFANGSVTLAGTLVLPNPPGQAADARHPALVLLHGSNPQQRGDLYYRMRAEWLAHYGIAVLLYDKRGVGDSTGVYFEWPSSDNLDNLAGDALAGVELLRTHPSIDPAQIGLQGDSQAGWVAPRIAARSDALAFMLLLVGPTTSPAQEGIYKSLIGPVDLGFSEMTEEQVTQRVLEAAGQGEFDPKEFLRAVTIPAYWIYGGLDRTVPSLASVAVLEELRAEGHTNHDSIIFPGANHSMYVARSGHPTDLDYLPGLHPDVYPTIRAWLLAHVTLHR